MMVDPLVHSLRQLRRRLAVQKWIRLNLEGLLFSLSASCVWVLAMKLFPVLGNPMPVCGGLVGLGVVAETVVALRGRPDLVGAALAADRRLGMKERFTSSLELAGVQGPMVEAVHVDARRHLNRLDSGRDFPYGVPRSSRMLGVPILLFGLINILPPLDLLHYQEQKEQEEAQKAAVLVSAEKLRAAISPLRKPSQEAVGELGEVTGEIERVAEALESQEITEKQALAQMKNLGAKLLEHREAMRRDNPVPKLAGSMSQLGMAQDLANSIQQGQMGEAAQKAEALKKKLREGGLTEEEKESLKKDLEQLAEMMGGKDTSLGKALAEAAQSLGVDDLGAAPAGLETVELSLEDIASALEQLEKMNLALKDLARWQGELLGPSDFCRFCGMPLEPCELGELCEGGCIGGVCSGICGRCAGIGGAFVEGEGGVGGGMGYRGHGRGGMAGELPEGDVSFTPTLLPGEMTKGKALMGILQRGTPDEDAESQLEYVTSAFVEVRQEAEEALMKEEIPPGAKEFVRQYFGSLEPRRAGLAEAAVDSE